MIVGVVTLTFGALQISVAVLRDVTVLWLMSEARPTYATVARTPALRGSNWILTIRVRLPARPTNPADTPQTSQLCRWE
jgi:hypothetical protein